LHTIREIEASIIDQIEVWRQEEQKQRAGSKKNQKNRKRPWMIALDGMCASGKTTLAGKMKERYPELAVIHMDDFFLQPQMRTPGRLSEPGGNVDYKRFCLEVVDPLVQTGSCSYRVYSCHSQSFVRTETLADPKIVLVEGAYSAHPYFGAVYDAVYFLSISKQEQKERILRRNGEAMLSRFLDEWIPMEEQYFETFGIREKEE